MKLRGHHLSCVFGFQGHRYSKKFIQKMQEASQKAKSEENFFIEVEENTDDICGACPFARGEKCGDYSLVDRQIREMDARIAKSLSVPSGKNYSKEEMRRKIGERIEPSDLDALCKGCKWISYGV